MLSRRKKVKKFFIVFCLIGGFLIVSPSIAQGKNSNKQYQKKKRIRPSKKRKMVVDFSKPQVASRKNVKKFRALPVRRRIATVPNRTYNNQKYKKRQKVVLKTKTAKSYWSFHCPNGFIRGNKVYCAKKGMSAHYDVVKSRSHLIKQNKRHRVAYKPKR